MTPQIVFIILVIIIVADFILESWLELLNFKNLSEKLPEELKDLYDAEKYVQSQKYERANIRFGLVSSAFNLVWILGMFFLDGFARVDRLAAGISAHPILHPLIFFGMLGLALDILNTPFAVYDTFVVEQRFGFNKTTPGLFIADKLKGWLLTGIIGGGLVAPVIWLYLQTTVYFWLWAWLLVSI
ncbi:MAG: M48 family peptidase, partial [Bacteroidales bacterium]|nr:M48 family peptidase [Bacteroidales bacterium]